MNPPNVLDRSNVDREAGKALLRDGRRYANRRYDLYLCLRKHHNKEDSEEFCNNTLGTPDNPGWHFYHDPDYHEIESKKHLLEQRTLPTLDAYNFEDPLEVRRKLLDFRKDGIREVYEKARIDTSRFPSWDRLIEFLKDQSGDTRWYRIIEIVSFALTKLDGYLVPCDGSQPSLPEDHGLTPEGVLRRLGMDVPNDLLEDYIRPEASRSRRQRPGSQHSTRAQPGSSPRASRELDLVEPPSRTEPEGSTATHRQKRDILRRHVPKFLRRDGHSGSGGPSSSTNSLNHSHHSPLRHAVIYGGV
ncbi:hypothetical protein JCM16303_003108 [Sporobolomyces ruberrimus]